MIYIYIFIFQLKSVLTILHLLVRNKSTSTFSLTLVSLILVAFHRNSVSHFSTIQLKLIDECNRDFESHFKSITTSFRLFCLLLIVAYTYLCTFVFDPRVGRYEKSKMFWFLFINIIYGLFNTTDMQYGLFKTLIYPENI